MEFKKFEEIIAWQKSKELTLEIYQKFCNCEDSSFKDQIQRASVSIMNNVAEGFERGSGKDFIKFLFYAKGSCGEVRSMLYLANRLNYINEKQFKFLLNLSIEISKIIFGIIKSIRTSL